MTGSMRVPLKAGLISIESGSALASAKAAASPHHQVATDAIASGSPSRCWQSGGRKP